MLDAASTEHSAVVAGKPGFLSRLFSRSGYRAWVARYVHAEKTLQSAQNNYAQVKSQYDTVSAQKLAIKKQVQEHAEAMRTLSEGLERLTNEYAATCFLAFRSVC